MWQASCGSVDTLYSEEFKTFSFRSMADVMSRDEVKGGAYDGLSSTFKNIISLGSYNYIFGSSSTPIQEIKV